MRLRQVALVARDLDRVEADLSAVFGWRVAYRDPIVAKWGLRNIVVPMGNEFLEVVSPIEEGTSAGRHLNRIGGDGGYMVMIQVGDRDAETQRLEAAGVRVVYRSDQPDYCLTQFHPADCGGLIFSWEQVLHPAGGDWRVPDGYWHAAHGEAWRDQVVTTRAGAVRRLVLQGPSPADLGRTYASLLGRPLQEGDMPSIELPGPDIGFVESQSPGALARLELEARDAASALAAARERRLPVEGSEVTIAGIGFRLI